MELNQLIKAAHENAVNKGFWEKPRETGTLIALIHSEVSEAMESETPDNFVEELADICIRIFDVVGGTKGTIDISWEGLEEMVVDFGRELRMEAKDITHLKYTYPLEVHHYLSAALEADRKGKAELFQEKLWNAIIITVAWADHRGYKLLPAILEKMEKNKLRSKMHGKKY